MQIDSYSFGKMIIDGAVHDKDLIILPHKILPSWWRHTSHVFDAEDCADILASGTELVIFGLGAYGLVKLDSSLIASLAAKNLTYISAPTSEAAELFNQNSLLRKTAAAFHLTC